MSIFKRIEPALQNLCFTLNACLTRDRPGYPSEFRAFEERRIDWEKDGIRRAIVIQPIFRGSGVDSNLWNWDLIAWRYVQGWREAYHKTLVHECKFSQIEENLDLLILESQKTLENITKNDLISLYPFSPKTIQGG